MSFGIPVRNGLGIGLLPSTAVSTLRIGGRPALILNFIGTTALDSRITFTRATTATFVGSNGLIQSSAINAPRFDYDPVTLAPKGLLIEEQRINLLLNSLIDGTSLSTQGVTVTAVAHTISFYGTGTITLTGAHAATVVGTGAYPNRQTLTFTPSAGTLTCTVTGSVQYAQLEVGSFATSFIPTAGAAVTRSADNATMTGTNFSSWYNQSEGTFVASSDTYNTANYKTIWQLWASDGNRILFRNSLIQHPVVLVGGAITANLTVSGFVANTPAKSASAIKANDFASAINGGTVVTAGSGALPAALTQIRLGRANDLEGEYLNGHIQNLKYYSTRLPNATLRALTA